MDDDLASRRNKSAKVSPMECAAIRLLRSDGYSQGELAMMFEVQGKTIARHDEGRCQYHGYPYKVRKAGGAVE